VIATCEDVAMTDATSAEKIDVDRERGVTIVFADGIEHFFANDDLRSNCPCATCRGFRDAGEEAWPRPGAPTTARIEAAELVGAWGISFVWNDTHSSGIFPFESLREWADGPKPEQET
jgi:DUF971 family protein